MNKRKLSIIQQVLPASSPFKPARKCIALPRTLNSACPGSVTLHPKKCNKAKQNRVFASVTLSGTTVPHEAQRRRKGVDFHGKGEPRFRATCREKRGKQQRSVSGFRLISSAAKSHFASVTSKMRRAHFPNECDLSRERGRKE